MNKFILLCAKIIKTVGKNMATVALTSLWACLFFELGDVIDFANGFFYRFGACVDGVSEVWVERAMFFAPHMAGLVILSAPLKWSLRFLGIASLLFYGVLVTLWSRPGCMNNYELLWWASCGGAVYAYARSGARQEAVSWEGWGKTLLWAAMAGAAALLAWHLCGERLFHRYSPLVKPIQGLWLYVNYQWVAVGAIVFYGLAPWMVGRLSGLRPTLFSWQGAFCSWVGAAAIAWPYAWGYKAASMEPVAFSALLFPMALAWALGWEGIKRKLGFGKIRKSETETSE